jgi:RHS repeat-associated protein
VEHFTYDSYGTCAGCPNSPWLVPANRTGPASENPRQHDTSFTASFRWRGNPTVHVLNGVTVCLSYDDTGALYEAVDTLGARIAYDVTAATNYAAPSRIAPNGEQALATSATYTQFLGIASATGPNNANTWATCDTLGRPTEVKSPHDQSPGAQYKTVYTYTVSPPTATATTAGRWTRQTMDGLGRTIKEERGDGSGTKSIVDTEYDRCPCSPLGKVKRVSQPYPPGGTLYWTTYACDSLGRTLSATVPGISGATTYTYNIDGTLAEKRDAKNQRLVYYYDNKKRVTGKWDMTSTATLLVNYYYDVNPYGTTENASGRLAAVRYTTFGGEYRETYGYTPGGRMKWKRVTVGWGSIQRSLDASWEWDNEGRMTRVNYPLWNACTYSYDSMGRLNGMVNASSGQTVASGVQYSAAGQVTAISYLGYSETRQYNRRLQLRRITASGSGLPSVDLEYRYSSTANDGRIIQMKDWVTGEEVNYTYDSLARLSTAVTTGPEWGLAFSYDGFGNLPGQTVTKGSGPTMSAAYDAATNRRVGASYDANGNEYGPATSYDVENRMKSWDGTRVYGYDVWNRRVYEEVYSGAQRVSERVTFYGAGGERMATYERQTYPYYGEFTALYTQVWFGGKLVEMNGERVVEDRLGSVVVHGANRLSYWPYGQEKPGATGQSRQKFATYWRDDSGLDYAMNRYYQNGRFLSPDAYQAPNAMANPIEWNRYAYVIGDPMAYHDPSGLDYKIPDGQQFDPKDPRNVAPGDTSITVTASTPMAPGPGNMSSWWYQGQGVVGGHRDKIPEYPREYMATREAALRAPQWSPLPPPRWEPFTPPLTQSLRLCREQPVAPKRPVRSFSGRDRGSAWRG